MPTAWSSPPPGSPTRRLAVRWRRSPRKTASGTRWWRGAPCALPTTGSASYRAIPRAKGAAMPASRRPDIAFDGHATLGEGPVWDDEHQRLVWVDILPGLVHRFDPATGGDHVFRAGKPVGSTALRHGGGLVLAVEDGFALLDPGWQRLDQVAVVEHPGPR